MSDDQQQGSTGLEAALVCTKVETPRWSNKPITREVYDAAKLIELRRKYNDGNPQPSAIDLEMATRWGLRTPATEILRWQEELRTYIAEHPEKCQPGYSSPIPFDGVKSYEHNLQKWETLLRIAPHFIETEDNTHFMAYSDDKERLTRDTIKFFTEEVTLEALSDHSGHNGYSYDKMKIYHRDAERVARELRNGCEAELVTREKLNQLVAKVLACAEKGHSYGFGFSSEDPSIIHTAYSMSIGPGEDKTLPRNEYVKADFEVAEAHLFIGFSGGLAEKIGMRPSLDTALKMVTYFKERGHSPMYKLQQNGLLTLV